MLVIRIDLPYCFRVLQADWKRRRKARIKMSPLKHRLPISMMNDKPHLGGESTNDSIGNGRWKRFKEFTFRALSLFSFGYIKYDIATNKFAEVFDGTKNVEKTSRGGGDVELGGNGVEETSRDDGDVELGRNGVEKTSREDGDVEVGGNGVKKASQGPDVKLGEKGSGTPAANHGKCSPSLPFWLKWSFYIFNFLLVLFVLVLDLISPENNTTYDLVGVVASSFTLVFGIIELVLRAKKEQVTWRKKGKIYWFYDGNDMPFGTSADMIGLVCNYLEFIMETVTRFAEDKVKDKPIYAKFFPVIFAFFLLVTKCLEEICAD
ncbi:hypothetical protein Pint_35175 [Pistacia integerrima]|uniref:Uncharacterized protein n=1 Tax=Pistacia integerrima TaxID=434235 RepID=A0ACC0Y142_9ROSI|nr:hypothetical protein Pint_35175 [Pistacia integerrima]